MGHYKKIIGEKIYLSPFSLDDVEIYTQWLNNMEITDNLGISDRMTTIENSRNWIKRVIDEKAYQFLIIELKNDRILGKIELYKVDYIKRIGEIGVFIAEKSDRGRGFAKEAINLLLDFSFNYLNLNNIMLGVFEFNKIAIELYEKIGFKEIGRRRKSYFLNGEYFDSVFMDILSEEFKEKYIKNSICDEEEKM